MSRRTVERLKEILERTEQARARLRRENPQATAVGGQMRRDEDALREAIAILTEHRP